jgi:hypothetical protein
MKLLLGVFFIIGLTANSFAGPNWVRDSEGNMMKKGSKVKLYDKGTECEGEITNLRNDTQHWVQVNWFKQKSRGNCPSGQISPSDLNSQDNK